MNIRDLQYLVAVADYQQFAKAADVCNVSQPSLSMQIKKLEEELGIVVFERTHKQIFITSVGDKIIAKARNILREVEEMRDIGKIFADECAGEFKLGLIPTVAPYLLPDFLPLIKKSLPKLEIHITESQTAVLLNELQQGTIDAAILALPIAQTNLESELLYEEPFYLAVPPGHRLARKSKVSHQDLNNEAVLLLEDGHCLREQAFDICSSGGAKEQTNFRASSLETLRHIIATGSGVTLMPKRALKKDDGLVYIPFTERNFKRTIGLVWRSSSPRKTLLKQLITSVR